ncbi:hypothetical protein XANCAGTX0491_007641 [Xanthoria calcicola]
MQRCIVHENIPSKKPPRNPHTSTQWLQAICTLGVLARQDSASAYTDTLVCSSARKKRAVKGSRSLETSRPMSVGTQARGRIRVSSVAKDSLKVVTCGLIRWSMLGSSHSHAGLSSAPSDLLSSGT